MSNKILVIDQGTTSTRAIVFDSEFNICRIAQKELKISYPRDGWVEQDAEQIWHDALETCTKVMDTDIIGLGITNQRETTVLWNKNTNKPIYPAIVWQDRRTMDYCNSLGDSSLIEKTGLVIDPYFSATKINWILNHTKTAKELLKENALAFGTIDSFLVWMLTEGQVHATDITNGSRTLLFDIYKKSWSKDLLELFDVPEQILPEVKSSCSNFGTAKRFDLPILGILGDQQAATFGQACLSPNSVKSTYGTGCFVVLNTGKKIVKSNHNLLTTIAYQINHEPIYALEGSIFMAGAIIQWLRDKLQIISSSKESEQLAKEVTSTKGVFLIPAFTGLGAPYWMPGARAAIVGMTRDTTKAHIIRAGLEAVAYQTKDLLLSMEKDIGSPIKEIRIDGGMIQNEWLCQFLADLLSIDIKAAHIGEITSQGVAFLVGLNSGILKSTDELQSKWRLGKIYEPQKDLSSQYKKWKTSVHNFQKMYS